MKKSTGPCGPGWQRTPKKGKPAYFLATQGPHSNIPTGHCYACEEAISRYPDEPCRFCPIIWDANGFRFGAGGDSCLGQDTDFDIWRDRLKYTEKEAAAAAQRIATAKWYTEEEINQMEE